MLTPRQRTLVALGPALAIGLLALVIVRAVQVVRDADRRVDEVEQVVRAGDLLLLRLVDAETGQRGYIITGDTAYLGPYNGANRDVARQLSRLVAMTRGSAVQQARVRALAGVIRERLDTLDGRIVIRRERGFAPSRDALIAGGGKQLMDRARALIAQIDAQEQRLLEERSAAERRGLSLLLLITVVGLAAAAGLSLLLNTILSRSAAAEARAREEVAERNALLEEQAVELESQQAELEAQQTELSEQAAELEVANEQLSEHAEAAERAETEVRELSVALRRRVEELEKILDIMPVGVSISLDPECRDMRVNRTFAELLRVSTDENISKSRSDGDGLPFRALRGGMELPPHELPMQVAARTGQPASDVSYDIAFADGTLLHIFGYATPLFDEAGNVRGAVGAFIDDTAREGLLEDERRARAEAQEANRAKAHFLSSMSHELRTPLNAILGYTDLIAAGVYGPVTEAQAKGLERVRASGLYLLALINNVLNFARVEAGKLAFHPTLVPVAEAISAVDALIRPQAEARGLTLSFAECRFGLEVFADPERLQQILLNLLGNACKFTESGGAIELGCHEEEDRVALSVSDTGCGIPADRLASIFEPFVQVDHDPARTGRDGVGLGLSISRELARAMAGDVTVESEPGKGSTFTLWLPASEEGARRHGAGHRRGRSRRASAAETERPRVDSSQAEIWQAVEVASGEAPES